MEITRLRYAQHRRTMQRATLRLPASQRPAPLRISPQRFAAQRNALPGGSMSQPRFVANADTIAVARLLAECLVGDTVPWGAITKLLARDASPGGAAYGMTLSARRMLEREQRIAFEAVPKEGLRRLNNISIVDSGDKFISSARRATRRGVIRLACVEYDELPNQKKIEHNTKLSVLGAIVAISGSGSIERIKNEVTDSALPAAKAAIVALAGIG